MFFLRPNKNVEIEYFVALLKCLLNLYFNRIINYSHIFIRPNYLLHNCRILHIHPITHDLANLFTHLTN